MEERFYQERMNDKLPYNIEPPIRSQPNSSTRNPMIVLDYHFRIPHPSTQYHYLIINALNFDYKGMKDQRNVELKF